MDKNNSSSALGDPTSSILYKIGAVFCILGTIIPLLTLTGRKWDYEFLLEITPGGIIVQNPLSSFCFILIGISLWLLRNEDNFKWKKIPFSISLLVSIIGLFKVIFSIFGFDFILDLVFFKGQLYVPYGYGVEAGLNAMAPNTAFCFFLLGSSVFFIDSRSYRVKVIMQYLDYLILLISLLSIYGYIYEVKNLYGVFKMIPMSFFTAVCFFLFSSSVLFLRSDKGTMAVLVGENPTEVVLLRFSALILPLVFGWLKIKGENLGLYGKEFGTALFAILTFVLSMFLIGRKSSIQYKLRKAKAKMHEIIKKDNERLGRVLGNSPTYINIYDLEEDRIIYSNDIGSRQLGYSSPITKMLFSSFVEKNIYPDDIPKMKERVLKFKDLMDNEYNELIYRLISANNEVHWLYSRATVYKRKNGNVKQILLNATDITTLKKVQDELSENKKFIEKITNTTPNILYIYDLNERKNVYANKNITEIIGYSPEEIRSLGDGLLPSMIHPEDRIKLKNYHHDFKEAKENEIREIEYRVKDSKGNWKWLLSRDTVFLRDPNNAVKQIIGIAQDITIRKYNEGKLEEKNQELTYAYNELEKAQKELKINNLKLEEKVKSRMIKLKESEERYKAFIQQSAVGIWRYEFSELSYIDITIPIEEQAYLILKYAYVAESNERMASSHGYDSADQSIGVGIGNTLLLDDEGKIQLILNFIKSGYQLINLETEEINKKGGLCYFRSNIIGIVEDNKLVRVWGTQQDITDKAMALKALRKSEEKYRFIVENIPEIFWTANAEGEIDFYNRTWYKYSGSLTIKDRGWTDYLHPDDKNKVLDCWRNCIAKNIEFRSEYRIKKSDGTYRWHLGRALTLKSYEGTTIKWMGTSTDIHELKTVQEELKYKNADLLRTNEELDNFIYIASHDLKVPIINIEGLIYTLNDELADECKSKKDADRILGMMTISVAKFKEIIFDLTEITEAQKGLNNGIQENNMSDVLHEVLLMVEDLIKTSKALIASNFNECPSINFSRRNLKIILYNLVSNSIMYRSPERIPEIFIHTYCLENEVLLSIRDNGIGFDTSQMDKAFSMFRKLHSHTEGSGIGLYIIKKIVTNSGGKIEVESKKGQGTLFKVYLRVNPEKNDFRGKG